MVVMIIMVVVHYPACEVYSVFNHYSLLFRTSHGGIYNHTFRNILNVIFTNRARCVYPINSVGGALSTANA